MIAFCKSILVYVLPKSAKVRVKAEVRKKKTVGVGLRARVLLLSIKALASLFLLVGRELQQEQQHVCRPAMLIDLKDKNFFF